MESLNEMVYKDLKKQKSLKVTQIFFSKCIKYSKWAGKRK